MARAVCGTPALLSNATPYGPSDSHAHKIPTHAAQKKKCIHLYVFFSVHTVWIVYVARTHRHTRPHAHPQRTPCPHLSGPSLLSAQPNSIRHFFSLSPWCSGDAGRNWTKYPQIPPKSWITFLLFSVKSSLITGFVCFLWSTVKGYYCAFWQADGAMKSNFCHHFVKSFGKTVISELPLWQAQ